MKEFRFRNRDGLELAVYQYGGTGPALHFYHANGFSANTYLSLLTKLCDNFTVYATDIRGHGKSDQPDKIEKWQAMADDLIEVLDFLGLSSVVALGHSLGAVTSVMAAVKRPDLFQHIIALDPVFFRKSFLILFALMRWTGLKEKMPPVIAALRRREVWDSRKQIIQTFKRRTAFKYLSDDYLNNYAEYAFIEDGNVIKLACPREIEADIYATIPFSIWSDLKKLNCPMLVVRGEKSDTLRLDAYKQVLKINDLIQGVEIKDAGHLLPMEKEEAVIRIINEYCERVKNERI